MEKLGHMILSTIGDFFHILYIFVSTFRHSAVRLFRLHFRAKETLHELFLIGVQSIPIVLICLFFISILMVAEFSFHLKMILQQDALVPAFATVLMLRELGPLIACLLLASRAGAGMAAEIASMKTTDQLDALESFGISWIDYLVVPRLIACTFAGICLSLVAAGIAVFGGALLAALKLGYNAHQYFQIFFFLVSPIDLKACVLKGMVFGAVIPIVASFYGFVAPPGSEGVGRAATQSVVLNTLCIIIVDFFITYWLLAV